MNEVDQFLDFEIRIDARRDDVYPIEIALGSGQAFQGHLAANILPWPPTGNPGADGQRLFQALFADQPLRTAWDRALGQSLQRRLRLYVATAAPELHTLPWELLHEEGVPLSADTHTPFSRYLAVSKPWGRPVAERPVRTLALISDPEDIDMYGLPPVDVKHERQRLEGAFDSVGRDHLQVDWLDAPVTLERLEAALLDGDCHVLHYLGHGTYSKRHGHAALLMEDEDGLTKRVLDHDLAQLLARQGVQPRLVFLAACESATRSATDAFLGMAPRLVSVGVPAVVAVQDLVSTESARRFSTVFYERLMAHGLVDLAANQARSTLLTAGRPDAAVPVLFMPGGGCGRRRQNRRRDLHPLLPAASTSRSAIARSASLATTPTSKGVSTSADKGAARTAASPGP